MTYKIYYSKEEYLRDGTPINGRGYTVFDIEYYIKFSQVSRKYYSEIRCLPCVEGLARYLKDNLTNKEFDLEQFIKDAEVIQEIRGFLYDWNDNSPKDKKEAQEFHHHVFRPKLEEIFDTFTGKYGDLYLDVD